MGRTKGSEVWGNNAALGFRPRAWRSSGCSSSSPSWWRDPTPSPGASGAAGTVCQPCRGRFPRAHTEGRSNMAPTPWVQRPRPRPEGCTDQDARQRGAHPQVPSLTKDPEGQQGREEELHI